MISGPSNPAPLNPSTTSDLEKIRVVTTLYLLLLLSVGVASSINGPFSVLLTTPDAIFIPVILYALAVYRYGPRFFTAADPALRARTWRRWLWTGAFLLALRIPVFLLLYLLFNSDARTTTLKDVLSGVPRVLLAMLLPCLWAWIGDRVFLRTPSRHPGAPSGARLMLPLSLIAGGALVLSSLLFDVSYYESPGWKMLAWRGRWVSDEFGAGGAAVRVPFDVLLLVFYVAALLFALACFAVALRIFARKSLAPRASSLLLHSGVVVLWFTLTNYFGNCLYFAIIGIFHFGSANDEAQFLAITALWLLLFVAGIILWFRFSRRTGPRAQSVLTSLILWAVPLMLATASTTWIALDYDLYGFIAFVFGVQILAACCWKIARPPLPAA